MSDQVRGFPAFPPGQRLARTWWGKAWIKALEDTSLDFTQLKRGRRYANAGTVSTITVSPGRIAADVNDEADGETYRTVVLVSRLTEVEWDRFGEQMAAKAGHIAALLDRDMPRELVETAADADVPLLPGIGDLEPECDCPSWELPCKHAAALCYQVSWLLDEDPFLLLLMRGRAGTELLDDLQQRTIRQPVAGTPVLQAYERKLPPLPNLDLSTPESHVLDDLPSGPGVDPAGLRLLAADAALRARALLAGQALPELDEWQDSVRLAATHGVSDRFSENSEDFGRAVRSWQQAGVTGLAVLETAWTPPAPVLARAAAALASAWEGEIPLPAFEENRWTWPERGWQLRYGPDSRWYPYHREADSWCPAGRPNADPVTALMQLSS
jgi:uncharacterized Zn finger protein